MRVVVTGGAGFIGANLCRQLVTTPGIDSVVVLDDLSTGSRQNLEGVPVELVEGSVLFPDLLDEVVAGARAVVHLAARPSVSRSIANPRETHAVNATGTMEVLEAARRAGVAHVVVASSSSVYGASRQLPKSEEHPARPLSPYAASKLAAESYALAHGHSFGLGVLALRFFNVFGPLQPADHAYAAVIPSFLHHALRGLPLPVHSDGRQTRDFTYVGTVCAVLTQAVRSGTCFEGPVNLAFGTRVSLLELIGHIEDLLGAPVERAHLPMRPGDVRDSQADTTRLRSLFPDVQPVGLVDGLRATLDWFRHGSPPAAAAIPSGRDTSSVREPVRTSLLDGRSRLPRPSPR
jgi:UDP-glucose 4-epimerase